MEPVGAIAVGDNDIKQCVCIFLKLAPYKSKRCFVLGWRGVERTALRILERVSRVHVRCALGHCDAVRAVPRYPLGWVSSCDMIGSGVLPTRRLARRDGIFRIFEPFG